MANFFLHPPRLGMGLVSTLETQLRKIPSVAYACNDLLSMT